MEPPSLHWEVGTFSGATYPMVRTKPNVLDASCPTRRVLDLIADKWTALAIHVLAGGTFRYGELHRALGGISQKMLTQTLRNLEANGLVKRTVHGEIPPRTEYTLTPLGRTLIEPLNALCAWAEAHMAQVESARRKLEKTG